MNEQRPSARPWYDLVTHEAAVRGWGIAELARRAGVGRPTIYGWRDSVDGRLQAAPVNAVADALGIPRERALRLAGIISTPDTELPPVIPESLRKEIMQNEDIDDDRRMDIVAAVEAALAKGRGARGTAASSGPGDEQAGQRRPAS